MSTMSQLADAPDKPFVVEAADPNVLPGSVNGDSGGSDSKATVAAARQRPSKLRRAAHRRQPLFFAAIQCAAPTPAAAAGAGAAGANKISGEAELWHSPPQSPRREVVGSQKLVELTCRKGHTLQRVASRAKDIALCDGCAKAILVGAAPFVSCAACGFDLCADCQIARLITLYGAAL
jgi:hypothetical protein